MMAAEQHALPLSHLSTAPSATPSKLAAIGAKPARDERREASVFAPLLMLSIAVIGWLGFQSVQLALEHRQIGAAQAIVDPQEQTAIKIRSSLDGVATATAKLAADGNPTARAIVEELRKRGVTINAQNAAATK
jgi:hypothetical protein